MNKILSAILVMLVSACATNPEYDAGWRTGRVEANIAVTDAAPSFTRLDCRSQLSDQYMVVSYSFGHNPNLRSAVVVPATGAKRGDAVRVNIKTCQQ